MTLAPASGGWRFYTTAGDVWSDVFPSFAEAAAALPPAGAVEIALPARAAILERLARHGWSVARGLPDLYVLPGAPARLESAVPARLYDRDLLVEIKGPTDASAAGGAH